MTMYGVKVTGTGSYLPEKVVTNDDLARIVDTSDEWIRTRTGIRERHLAAPDEPTSALGAVASERALEAAGRTAEDVEMLVVATFSPDRPFPNTGCFVQKRIGAKNAACFSMEAACTGFLYALEVSAAMVRSGVYRTVLLVGAEKLSSLLNYEDRTTCVLFGDGAGALVLERCAPEEDSLLASTLGADGTYTDILQCPAGGSEEPFSAAVLESKRQYLTMSGQEVFKLAVRSMCSAAEETLQKAALDVGQLRWLIPHQANLRIIRSVARHLSVPEEKTVINVERTGNTSAASIPIALDELVRRGDVARGDNMLFAAFGGGLTWGAAALRW